MDIPNTQEILLFRPMLCAIVLFFGATYAIAYFIDSFFLCQTYAVILLKLGPFETGKYSFSGYCTADCRFFCSGISRLFHCLSFLLMMIFLKHHYKLQLSLLLNMCSRGTLFASLKSSILFPIIFYRVLPIFLGLEIVYLGVSTSLNPTFVDDGKDMLSNNRHAMGGICKEGWLWYFLIKFSFG